MFRRTPKIPLDVEIGVTLIDQEQESYQHYAKKLQAKLKWAYQKAQENNRKESEWQKKYYDQKMRCMSFKPDNLVLVHVKAPSGHHKIIDQWEDKQYLVLSQLDNQPVFQVQPEDAATDKNIRILHRNMLFSIQTVTDQNLITTTTESLDENRKKYYFNESKCLNEYIF